jgi:hypothetical protein
MNFESLKIRLFSREERPMSLEQTTENIIKKVSLILSEITDGEISKERKMQIIADLRDCKNIIDKEECISLLNSAIAPIKELSDDYKNKCEDLLKEII